ncbi:MAG: vancomycin high temperature exclusion protein [Acidimicrobiales bacterium]
MTRWPRIRIGRRTVAQATAKLAVCGSIAVLCVVGLSGAVIAHRAEGRIVVDPTAVPERPVVIVPGARVLPSGEPGPIVEDRLAAAADLVGRGITAHVLVSGDNRTSHYNEPVVMRNWLADQAGIDPDDVTLDYAGFDTWDSCVRARDQFGVDEAVVVTEHRYARRTAALCDAAGIDVIVLAIDSPPQPAQTSGRLWLRERLAAIKAWSDIARHAPAHHGGPFVGLVGSADMPEGGHPPDWNGNLPAPDETDGP